jgi:uncharacterized small protein (DUF1192 family)
MTDLDRMHPLGHVTDYEGQSREVRRDYDGFDLRDVGILRPLGVAELKQRIAEYEQELACFRLRTADLSGIDLDDALDTVAHLPGCGGAGGLEAVDWVEVGNQMKGLRRYGGFGELGRLHALLTGTETPKEA